MGLSAMSKSGALVALQLQHYMRWVQQAWILAAFGIHRQAEEHQSGPPWHRARTLGKTSLVEQKDPGFLKVHELFAGTTL